MVGSGVCAPLGGLRYRFRCPLCGLMGAASALARPPDPFALYLPESLGYRKGFAYRSVPVELWFMEAVRPRVADTVFALMEAGVFDPGALGLRLGSHNLTYRAALGVYEGVGEFEGIVRRTKEAIE